MSSLIENAYLTKNNNNNITMNSNGKKVPYQPPQLELFEYEVEHGFADSPDATTLTETFSEINDASGVGGSGGENFHGEWF